MQRHRLVGTVRDQIHPENPVRIPWSWARDPQDLVCFLGQVVRRHCGECSQHVGLSCCSVELRKAVL